MGTSATAATPSSFRVYNVVTPTWSTAATAVSQAAGTTGTGVLTSASAGAFYNFANGVTASSTDRALGVLGGAGFPATSNTANIVAAYTNNTGATVTSLYLEFDYEKYRSGSRQWFWSLFYGTTAGAQITSIPAGSQTYDADANNLVISNPPTSTNKFSTITGLSIANGTTVYLRWQLVGNGGTTNGQAIGIDNFNIVLNPVLPTLTSITSTTVCTGTLFSYTPTSATSGATFTWTRAAVAGISNAAVTTETSGAISETLVNTGTTPRTVTYVVTSQNPATGVKNTQSVTVVVNPLFTNVTTSLPGAYYGANAWGDYDNDGDLDVLISGNTGAALVTQIWTNTGSGFSQLPTTISGPAFSSAVWGDYDNDGDLDVLLSGSTGTIVTEIWTNTGGAFSKLTTSITGVYWGSTVWGDYDNDGDLDILLSGRDGAGALVTQIWTNTGGAFSKLTTSITGVYQSSAAWGDYDNDGDLDVLVAGNTSFGSTGGVTQIWTNTGGTFSKLTTSITGVYQGSVAWGDYDNDGDLDVLLSGLNGTVRVTEIWTNTAGSFSKLTTSIPGVNDCSVAWGDYDNDGDLDVLVSGTTTGGATGPISQVWTNTGGVFSQATNYITGLWASSVAWADYDKDGDLDMLLSGLNSTSASATQIWTNNSVVLNSAPAAPTGLSATQTACGTTTLTWNQATDAQTSQNGLAYNIRIGTVTNGIQKLSPMANVTNGYRRIASIGKVQWRAGGYVISGLAPGTYYWSVQATDAALAGGAWATEGTFTITAPPTLSSTLTPPAICSNTAFTYSPESATTGATFTWTRAAVAGISNAAVTTVQTSNPRKSNSK